MGEGKEIGKGALYIIVGKFWITLIGILSVTLIPKILGPENMGFYSYWLSIFLIIAAILDLGGSWILARYIPELRKRKVNSIIPLIKKNIEVKFLPFIILLLGGLFFLPSERTYFVIIMFASLSQSLSLLIQMGLYSYKDMKKYSFVLISRSVFRFVLILVLFTVLGSSGILFGILVSGILVTIICGHVLIELLPKSSGKLEKPFREYLSFGLLVYLGALFFSFTTWSVVILTKVYIEDLAIIGFLGLALLICLSALLNIIFSVGESVLPSLIEFHTISDKNFQKAFELNWKYTNIILFPSIFGLLVLAKPLMLFVIGKEYLPTADLIKFFLPATAFLGWSRIHQQILIIFEKKKEIFESNLIGFGVFFISGLILIKNMGISGAPISVSLGAFAGFIYFYINTSKIMKIRSYQVYVLKPFAGSLLMGLLIGLIDVKSVGTLGGTIILGGIIYFIIMMLIGGIVKGDINRVRNIF